jgi:hypothetical protein
MKIRVSIRMCVCVYVYVCVNIYVYIHVHIHIQTYMCRRHAYMHTRMCVLHVCDFGSLHVSRGCINHMLL